MRIKLLKDQRIAHKAGDIVEVSPEVYRNLVTLGIAVAAGDEAATKKKRTTKK